jgi:hypothetical protein
MYAVCKGQFSVRNRGAAAAMGEAPREREHRPVVIIAAGTMRPISFATALWKLEPFPSQEESRSVCACEQHPTGLRDALAVGHETIGDLLAIGNEFRTHCQRVVHAGFAALLVVVGGFAGEDARTRPNSASPSAAPKCEPAKPGPNPLLFGRRRIRPCARHPQSRPHALCYRHAQTRRQSVRW